MDLSDKNGTHQTEITQRVTPQDIKEHKDPVTLKKASTNFISGAVGGAGSTCISHPLDSMKVKLQTFPHLYRGGAHCVQEVLRQQGVRGLYRGLTPAVTLSTTEASIRYGIYGVCQDFVRKTLGVANSENMSLVQNALAGGLTGFLATFASCPIELVKCRMQGMMEMAEKSGSKQHQLRGPLAVCGHILRHEGPRGLYHGFLSNMMRNTPGEMVFFATYEQMRWLLKRPGQIKDDIGPLGNFACGCTAGVVYWLAIYPLDSVKSRVQVLSSENKVAGPLSTLVNILRTEGVRPLYRGVGYSIPRGMIGSGSHFVFYEATRRLLRRHDNEDA